MDKIIPLLGLGAFVFTAWAISLDRRRFPWRVVASGLALQMTIAWLILGTAAGRGLFDGIKRAFEKLLGFAQEGVSFVFGPLADQALLEHTLGKGHGFVFVVTVTGTIVLVSALSSLLYHYGILQLVVRSVAWVMRKLMGTSGSESLAAAANIFMGQTEAPLVIKPYLPGMTRSELMALMTGGMATIAGGVLAAYVAMEIDAGHLLTASVISAPASLMIAKIILPETQQSQTASGAHAEIERPSVNGLDAMCTGASDGMKLAINVFAMLIAFVAMVALVNYALSLPLRWIGHNDPRPLQTLLGWINAPFAWLMGVPASDCLKVGGILGQRIVLNEFMGYAELAELQKAGAITARSSAITTYALCGFANFASIAIQIGGIGALAPERRADLARLGILAMVGGLLACYCTASVAAFLL